MATPTTNQLREAITEIDSMSQGAFSEIAALAKLALASLETPAAYDDPEGMVYVLSAIREKAKATENLINCAAEDVGCNYKDEAMYRRWAAQSKASKTATNGGG